MAFYEHGEFSLAINDNRLDIDAVGPFNREVIADYDQQLQRFADRMPTSLCKGLLTLHGMSLFTPDAEQALVECLLRWKRLPWYNAVLIDDVQGKAVLKQQLGRCYDKTGITYAFFDDRNEALHWLSQQDDARQAI
ncbi:hypothetical protein LJ739_17800 [Aestuariibacter halophilus]|uniref:STAS/SEC14 domain-containing protein n=1 Tax=Fluctibacter halophilus TaxID=226011 RepID=A0ABS8GE88_9ALTE|nr:hypothetical protein [Aestuariibacter halophilus]MCC2618114.1 hypothetical protein [Aestuariibacter halophilus]